MNISVYIILVALLLVAAALVIIINSQRRTISGFTEREIRSQQHIIELTGERERAVAEAEALKSKIREDKESMESVQASFRAEFRNLATEIFDEKSRVFRETNKESVESLLKPFNSSITQFRERVEKIYSEENQHRGALKNELKNLMELNRRITEETTNLTGALKGNSKVQGDWGEVILQSILDSTDLVQGRHYEVQKNIKDEEGRNQRPDVVLTLPDDKKVVIDSKVSLTAFVEYSSADNAVQRDAALDRHLKSVRRHLGDLGQKKYQEKVLGSPDFVIMFVPSESAFLAALHNDPSIWNDAYARNVVISSPTNIFGMLRIVDDLWRRDTQSANTRDIAKLGSAMVRKFEIFTRSLSAVGKNIGDAQKSYDKAMKDLNEGRGNLTGQSEKMKVLLGKMPPQIMESPETDAGAEGEDE